MHATRTTAQSTPDQGDTAGCVSAPHTISRRAALVSGVALMAGVPLAKAAAASVPHESTPARLTLPTPTGRHPIGSTTLHLIDNTRPDPWVPTIPFRELMIQLWYPAAAVVGHSLVPWMTPVTALAWEHVYGYPGLPAPITAAHLGAPARQRPGGWPVVLYSHSLGGDRAEATCLVEDLASHGYIVVTIDHIHDADVVELPDGRLEFSAMPPLTAQNEIQIVTKAITSRVADVSFVLDQLALLNHGGERDQEHRRLPTGLRGALDMKAVGMFGHSDGGSTTAQAIHVEPRITAGANLDGTLWTPQARSGSLRPFLLFGRQNLDAHEADTWAVFQANQRGPELQLNLTGSTHLTFVDLAVLVPQAASALDLTPQQVAAIVGSINGQRAVTIERAYLKAFFDSYLRHHPSSLLSGPSPSYPEVLFHSRVRNTDPVTLNTHR